MAARGDRYEPLPGLLGIPRYLVRKLSPRGRRILAIVAGVLAVAVAVGLVLAIPAIDDSKTDRAAAQQRAEQQRLTERTAQLQAEMRLLNGRGTPARGLEGGAAVTARQAVAADLAVAVERDARARVQAGELENPVQSAHCERYPRGARGEDPATDLSSPTGRYACLAVTAEVEATERNEASDIGYPYRALVDFPSGRFTYCKVSGKPGEGGITRDFPVKVPRACGGGG
jgi:cell division protein FtsB